MDKYQYHWLFEKKIGPRDNRNEHDLDEIVQCGFDTCKAVPTAPFSTLHTNNF